MDPRAGSVLPRAQARARPSPREARPPASFEDELYDCLDYFYLRDFPACGAGRSKGRTRRERELRTNRQVPGGHERKIAQKLLNGQRKRRQRQLQTRPRTRLA
ncbi:nuclear protein 2 [Orycteropus afer afer]|uniref:Nuclear protein 2 n=1 Tax=Orycteropus afer afer TaxID=1230840 RepID=A0A8B6ZYF2_ORYAF|nr:nuclear protein 2 [Orycteropus afer afer]